MTYRAAIEEAERRLQEARIQASRSGDRRTCEDLDRAITNCLLAEGGAGWGRREKIITESDR